MCVSESGRCFFDAGAMQSEGDHLIRFALIAELAGGTGHRGVGLLRTQHDTVTIIRHVKFSVLRLWNSENSETTFADVIISFGLSLATHVDGELVVFGKANGFGSCKTFDLVMGVGEASCFSASDSKFSELIDTSLRVDVEQITCLVVTPEQSAR